MVVTASFDPNFILPLALHVVFTYNPRTTFVHFLAVEFASIVSTTKLPCHPAYLVPISNLNLFIV